MDQPVEDKKPIIGEQRAFGATEEPEVAEGDEPATEEEQAQYELVVSRATQFMHGQGRDSTLKVLGSSETPSKGIGTMTAKFTKMVSNDAKNISKVVLFHAATEILEDLMELGIESGVFQFDSPEEEQEQLDEGLMWALKIYGEAGMEDGTIDRDAAHKEMVSGLEGEGVQVNKTQVAQGVGQAVGGGSEAIEAAEGGLIAGQMMGAK